MDKVNLTSPPSVCGSQDDSGWEMGELFKKLVGGERRGKLFKKLVVAGNWGSYLKNW